MFPSFDFVTKLERADCGQLASRCIKRGFQKSERVFVSWKCFLERQIGSKQRDPGLGHLTWLKSPVKRSLFFSSTLLVIYIGIIQYGSCFMKRQTGKAKGCWIGSFEGKASRSVPLLRTPQNAIRYIFRKLEMFIVIWKQCRSVIFGHFKEDRKRFQPNICKSFQPDTNPSA